MESSVVGYIRVRVTNSGGEFPIEGATVTITDYNAEDAPLLYSLRTDSSGLTRPVTVAALPASESQTPGMEYPYTLYNIRATKENYYPAESIGVPVFEGIVSLQQFRLQPLSESDLTKGGGDRVINEVIDAPGLQGQGYPNSTWKGGEANE